MTTAIVLAGGLGTRLRGVVSDVPKPMAPIAGRPFLAVLLDYWIGQGVTRFVLSVGYMHEKVQAYFGSEYGGASIAWSVEDQPLGTGGALIKAWHTTASDASVLVLNGDTFLEARLAELAEKQRDTGADGIIAAFEAPLDPRYATIAAERDGRISRFGAGAAGERGYMNGGVYLLSPSFFEGMIESGPQSLESSVLPAALDAGKQVYVSPVTGRFIDIGVPEDYARAAAVLGANP